MNHVDQYADAERMLTPVLALLLMIVAYTAGVVVGHQLAGPPDPTVVYDANAECLP